VAGRIRDEDIAAVRERSPIDEVVGEYLQLRNAGGGSLKGLCPFHDEKTPSFNVTPARGLFYCLAGETRVLTWDGVKPIRELAGRTHRILGKYGDWIDAPFRSFGVQPLMRLTVTRNGISKHIYATAEHRWFVRSGKMQTASREVITSDLRRGHRLVSKFPGTRVKQTPPSPFGIAHWIVREVTKTDRVEEVFCATVDGGHAFTLEDNILTGNCFSCAEGGDAIKFVQKIDGLSFVEAVERLAARAGVELRYEQGGYVPGQEQSQRRRLIDAHRLAAGFYAERIAGSDAAPARAFLAERGFELTDIERFGVGYSPKAWEDLTRHLRGRGFTDSELIAAGLAIQGNRGPRDRFRGRLMWPIRDLSGDVIAFGARKLDPDDDGPKYLNTPETSLFRKSTVLYGADLAKREIAQRRQAVIVEGYTDVMACHLAGVPTAVATCGTSFGEDHIKVLRRLIMDSDGAVGEVIFTFDGDAAGQRAAQRAFGMEERFVTQTFVAVQPDGLDPCDLRLANGDAAVRDLIARRVPLFEFAIKGVLDHHNLNTTEGQLAALDEAAPIVGKIKNKGLRDRYAVNLDRWLGLMDENFVLSRVRAHARDTGPGRRRPGQVRRQENRGEQPSSFGPNGGGKRDGGQPYDLSDHVVAVEREVLKLAIQRPALCGPEFDALGADAFTVPVHRAVFMLIAECGGTAASGGSARDWAARLRDAAPNERAQAFITELAVEPLRRHDEPDEKYADIELARVGELAVSREITSIKGRLQRTNPLEEQAKYNRLFGDLITLEARRRTLVDRGAGG
jgi:DNA primase